MQLNDNLEGVEENNYEGATSVSVVLCMSTRGQ